MLAISGNARIFLCQEAIDMRKGFEGHHWGRDWDVDLSDFC